jgi:CYTH domain-containing protein
VFKQKYARLERERRYLVCDLPEELTNEARFSVISDRYIKGTRLRLRTISDPQGQVLEYKFGQKFLPDDSRPADTWMTNIYLNAKEYELLAALEGAPLRKRRYSHQFAGRIFSIDVFQGSLEGLVLCETELGERDHGTIKTPPFVSHEVTADPFFTGASLVHTTAEELGEKLRDACHS